MSLFNNLEKFSSNTCVIDDDLIEYNYKDLLLNVKKLSKHLTNRSVGFLICKNNYEFVISYVSLIRSKAVFFLINKETAEKKFLSLIYKYKPDFIISPIEKIINKQGFEKIYQIKNKYNLFKSKNKNKKKIHKDLALLLSTSGSTGTPKYVKLSYLNLYDNAKKIAKYLNIKSTDRPITTMEPSYSYAMSILNSHLISGASIIVTEKSLVEKNFWGIFKQKKATTFGGVPFIYDILKKLKFDQFKLPYLRYITQAGGNLNNSSTKDFIEICKNKKIKLIIMYGQTEASPRMSFLDWKFIDKKIGSIGKPITGGNFLLCDENNQIFNENDKEGELVYEGKNVMLGYAENLSDLETKDDNKSMLFTGDLAKKDKDGFYYITGRKSRFIKIFGKRVSLDEVQNEINLLGVECACVGGDDHLKIYTSSSYSKDKLSKYIKENFKINKLNLSIFRVTKIPRSENGKILYPNLESFKT